MAVNIFGVTANSHADRAKIKSGEILLSINGNIIEDVLDYRFLSGKQRFDTRD